MPARRFSNGAAAPAGRNARVARRAAARAVLGIAAMLQPAIQCRAAAGPWRSDVTHQHDALHLELNELRAVVGSCPATRRSASYHRLLAVLVSRLAERLALHFAEESAAAYLEAVATQPGLRPDVARFQRVHADLLAEARRLADVLRRPLAPPDAVTHLLHWIDALAAHEVEERPLLQSRREP